jgi:hypothetical protein
MEPEHDIEGVAQVDDRMYWIGSHGRNKTGKEKKDRQRLFATTVGLSGATVKSTPVGKPYKKPLSDLTSEPSLAALDLATAATKEPEEAGGLNIEGLASAPERHLLIGFRNPIRVNRALLVKVSNPGALVDGTATCADLSVGGLLDLQGRGIRALEFVPALGIYIIRAAAFDEFEWWVIPPVLRRR